MPAKKWTRRQQAFIDRAVEEAVEVITDNIEVTEFGGVASELSVAAEREVVNRLHQWFTPRCVIGSRTNSKAETGR